MSRSPDPRGAVSRLAAAVVALWAGAAGAVGVEADSQAVGAVRVGVFCTQDTGERRDAPGSVAGHSNIVRDIVLRAETLVVPVSPDLTFGYEALFLRDAPGAEMRITHPPFPGFGATEQRFEGGVAADALDHGLYTFDNGYEMVEGLWRFEVIEGERTLLSVELRAVPAAQAPQFVGLCQGPPLLGAAPPVPGRRPA